MYKAAVRWKIRRNARALTRGDVTPLLSDYAEDAVLVIPGQSSWGGEHRGKAAIESFLWRFVEVGLKGKVHDILVNGPPWRTTVCVLFTDRATDDTGTVIYENRAVLFGRVVWGKIVYQEGFEDTCKADKFDVYLQTKSRSGD